MKIERAKREKLKAAIAIIGASGSGKTLSAIKMGLGMLKEKYPNLSDSELAEKIGVIDTEHKRSLIYSNRKYDDCMIGEFLFVNMTPPFSPQRFKEAIELLKKNGVEVVIVDSLSHVWEGQGGLLDMQQTFGGTFQAWNKVKPHIQELVKTLTENGIHTIVTMRTKIEYAAEASETGKLSIRKLGLKPIMKDDLEYEFQLVFMLNETHEAKATKDNSGMFTKDFTITTGTGQDIYKWLELGVDVNAEQEEKRQTLVTTVRSYTDEKHIKLISQLEKKAGRKVEDFPSDFLEKALLLLNNK